MEWLVLGATIGWLLGKACSRWNAKPKPEAPPSEPPPPWLEQHVRRRSALGIHQQHKHVKQERQSVKLASLQHQLSPHFLFNALNSVHWLWNRGDRNRAIESMEAFMALGTTIGTRNTEGWHGLTDEFASIKRYLLLESIRLDLPLNMEVCMPPNSRRKTSSSPNSSFKPIAENSIWHGFSPTPPAGTTPRIQIEATWEEGWATEWGVLGINIRDNGRGFASHGSSDEDIGRAPSDPGSHKPCMKATIAVTQGPEPWSTTCSIKLPLPKPMAPARATEAKGGVRQPSLEASVPIQQTNHGDHGSVVSAIPEGRNVLPSLLFR